MTLTDETTPYGAAALRDECAALADAEGGARHETMHAAVCNLAELVDGDEIAEDDLRAGVEAAWKTCGAVDDRGADVAEAELERSIDWAFANVDARSAPSNPPKLLPNNSVSVWGDPDGQNAVTKELAAQYRAELPAASGGTARCGVNGVFTRPGRVKRQWFGCRRWDCAACGAYRRAQAECALLHCAPRRGKEITGPPLAERKTAYRASITHRAWGTVRKRAVGYRETTGEDPIGIWGADDADDRTMITVITTARELIEGLGAIDVLHGDEICDAVRDLLLELRPARKSDRLVGTFMNLRTRPSAAADDEEREDALAADEKEEPWVFRGIAGDRRSLNDVVAEADALEETLGVELDTTEPADEDPSLDGAAVWRVASDGTRDARRMLDRLSWRWRIRRRVKTEDGHEWIPVFLGRELEAEGRLGGEDAAA